MFLITGYPRSGTKYMATVLREAGLDVGHEYIGADGTVDWRGPPIAANFAVILHQVRYPLNAIASAATIGQSAFNIMYKRIGGVPPSFDPVVQAMYTWVYWNGIVEEMTTLSYRIEELPDIWPSIWDHLGLSPVPPFPARVPTNTNTRIHRRLTWADLDAADPKLAQYTRNLARRYGYRLDLPSNADLATPANPNARRCPVCGTRIE